MPVDTSLYRMLETPPPVATPTEVALKKQTLANLAQGHDLQAEQIATNQSQRTGYDMQNEERFRQQQEAQTVRDLLASEPDLNVALPKIMAISPTAGAVFAKHIDEQRKAALERQQAQFDLYAKRKGAIAMDSAALLAEKDPAKRAAMYKVQHAARTASGLYAPNELAQFPSELPKEEELRAVADQIQTAKNADQERAAAEAKRKQETHDAELPGKTADEETGLTPAQAESARHNKATEDATSKHNKATEEQMREANRIRRERINAIGAQTANSTAIDRRKDETEFHGLEVAEGKLHTQRRQLGIAIKNKNVYVDRLGNTVPMDKASQGLPETAATLIEEMQQRYSGITDDLKKSVAAKNAALERLGRKVGTSTADAWAALDAGDEPKGEGKPLSHVGAPAAQAKPKPAPKPAAAVRPRAVNANGNAVEWDGKSWVPAR